MVVWLKNHPQAPSRVRELVHFMQDELMTKPISDVKFHLKLESLLKEEPIT